MNESKRIHNKFRLKYLGIKTNHEFVLFIRADSTYFRSEGFESRTRVVVKHGKSSLVATIYSVLSDILSHDEVSLSESAWKALEAKEGDRIGLFHAELLESIRFVRSKLHGNTLNREAFDSILKDIVGGLYSDIHLASFVTACSNNSLSKDEIKDLTAGMVASGSRLNWLKPLVLDKHCVGGLPGNRTTLIVIPILACFGITLPKTSSRAITSPSGTADTMEVFCPVNHDLEKMRRIVNQENACIIWGGRSQLSPADDALIHIEKALDLDSIGLMISSVLSKKIAAGSTHVLIDIPIGSTAKIRSKEEADRISKLFIEIGSSFGLKIAVYASDGSQPIGRGIGPALEAKDVFDILSNDPKAPQDLRSKALKLAGLMLELAELFPVGMGIKAAEEKLQRGEAMKKFQAICKAQGGFQIPQKGELFKSVEADRNGVVSAIDNRRLSMLAKLAGAPRASKAGVEFLAPLGTKVSKGQVLYRIYSETIGELNYALEFVKSHPEILKL